MMSKEIVFGVPMLNGNGSMKDLFSSGETWCYCESVSIFKNLLWTIVIFFIIEVVFGFRNILIFEFSYFIWYSIGPQNCTTSVLWLEILVPPLQRELERNRP